MLVLGLESKSISPFPNPRFQEDKDELEEEGTTEASEADAMQLARQQTQAIQAAKGATFQPPPPGTTAPKDVTKEADITQGAVKISTTAFTRASNTSITTRAAMISTTSISREFQQPRGQVCFW